MKAAAKSAPASIKTILFATDFSDVASRAQSYATGLANRFGAKLIVVHAKEAPNYALPPETWHAADEADAFNRRKLQDSLDKSSPGLRSQIHVGEGPVWQVVESALKKSRSDLIVLGTRGRTGGARLLLGSQAEAILRRSSCPVLTVGPNAAIFTGGEKELREVLYATDFSPESQAAAPYAVSIALALQAHLNLLHVVEDIKVGELVHPADVLSSSEPLLKSLIPKDAEFWSEPRCFVERGDAARKILEVAQDIPANLIVLGVRKATGIPGAATHLEIGLAHKVITAATCPVLTVRR